MGFLIFLVYLLFGILVAYGGRRTRLGFWPIFVLSMLTTPLIMAGMVLLFGPRTASAERA